ncbi:enoyl-CoA hydratase [Agromyces sp. 3263]|uniref:enoyl-CoA hydratase/isomerase family protein n=1 Tax=Agromyces sp. 3263 TaxID=2817750 RepID=UPI0028613966|nr:enoyl-CoA hydratase-related protein [Agromyces sp. 3263]MDR6907909.1 enoyl-CoA hydratase [Agromyces sp. 3263]
MSDAAATSHGDERAVRVERDGRVATVVIDRPKSLNALSPEVLGALAAVFDGLSDDPGDLAGVLLVGAGGRAFVAGADIRALSRSTPAEGAETARLGHRVAATIEALPLPVIACVDGFALGGGLELALACDFIYATDASRFGQPEVKLGLIPGFGGTVRLPRVVGPARARELIYTGRQIGIEEAVAAGLVLRRFEDREALLAGARETVELMATGSASAVGLAKRVLVAASGQATDTATELEIAGFEDAFRTGDKAEGVAAFLEKREPRFADGAGAGAGTTPA